MVCRKLSLRLIELAWVGSLVLAIAGVAHGQTRGSPSADTAGTASTGGCGTRRLGETAVALVGNTPTIAVSANGVALTLLLDTGAERTTLTPAAAERINAKPPRIAFQRQMRGIAGSLQSSEVELQSFAAGPIAIPWRRLAVAPVTIPMTQSAALDGLFGADSLSDFDIDLDLPQRRLTFYQKQTCPSAAPAWPPRSYTVIETGRSRGEHLFFAVRLDGSEIGGFFDTGANISTLSTRKALAFGVTDAVLARDPPITQQGATAGRITSHLHRFSQLQVGSEAMINPTLAVANVNLSDADIVLGIDFMRSRHIWLSYGSRRIFLSKR